MLPEERVHCEEANIQLLTSYDFSLDTQVRFSLTSAHPKSELLSFMARFGIVVACEARGKQNLIRFAHNWNVGIMECWNNGFWQNGSLGYWQNHC